MLLDQIEESGHRNRVIIIGFGHHARRIHYPILMELKETLKTDIVGVIDVIDRKDDVSMFLGTASYEIPTLFIDPNKKNYSKVTKFAKKQKADCVIISTGPEDHVAYGIWALSNGINTLIDKPIHAEPMAAHNTAAAKMIHKNFLTLDNYLKKARIKYPNIVCEVLTQRRFHPAYRLIKDQIEEVYAKTGCPITYYYAYHNDGQWRMPQETRDITYHGFELGYGKASHSGYHFYDLLNWFSEIYQTDRNINAVRTKAWGNFPGNLQKQINQKVLANVFDGDYCPKIVPESDYENYGEVDVMSTFQLCSGKDVVTHAQIDLQHSGISSRSWPVVGDRGLYKGNGRIRHEQHYINLGPFMSISLTSWQSKEFSKEEVESTTIYDPGHEFNLDINIFRNKKLIGGKQIERLSLKDIYYSRLADYSRGHQEDARRAAIIEFFSLVTESDKKGTSPLESHSLSSLLMSSVYQSMASDQEVNIKYNRKSTD